MALWTACALLLLLATTGCSGAPVPGEPEDVPEEDPAAPSPSPSPAAQPSQPAPAVTQPNATASPPCRVIPPRFPVVASVASFTTQSALLHSPTAAKALACGLGWTSWYGQLRYGAVNQKLHDACGHCIAAMCTDPDLCKGATTAVLPVLLLDDCGHCGEGDVLLSPLAINEIAGMTQGSVPAEWFFVPCGPFLTGDIRMDIMPGSNPFYTQLTFSNFADPIMTVTVQGQPLEPMDWHRWIWYNDGRPLNRSAPINITLWGRSGAVRRASLMDLAEDQYDLGVQF